MRFVGFGLAPRCKFSLQVMHMEALTGFNRMEVLRLAAAAERGCCHPIGATVCGFAAADGLYLADPLSTHDTTAQVFPLYSVCGPPKCDTALMSYREPGLHRSICSRSCNSTSIYHVQAGCRSGCVVARLPEQAAWQVHVFLQR